MKKGYCQYLEDLGIPIEEYRIYTDRLDKRNRRWRKQRRKYGFDDRETWSLDEQFIQWIYTRFKMYKEIAGEIVNLEYYKFQYIDKEVTQLEAIDIILKACEDYLKTDFLDRKMISADIGKLLIEVMPAMWW